MTPDILKALMEKGWIAAVPEPRRGSWERLAEYDGDMTEEHYRQLDMRIAGYVTGKVRLCLH